MDIEVIKKNYYFEKLTEIHELKDFDCGSVDLNDFIKNDALRDQKQNLNVTKLIMFEQKIIGFFSLVADSITIKQLNHEDGAVYKNKIKYKSLPSLKIGRFALDKKYTNKGLGSLILLNINYNIRNIAKEHIGIRFITVDGYAKAYTFYKKNNFKHFKKHDKDIKNLEKIKERDPEKTIYMYQDIQMIK